MSNRDYAVVYERGADGCWSAYAVDLPVVASADTRAEIEASIREAIQLYLDYLIEQGEVPPSSLSEAGTVTVSGG